MAQPPLQVGLMGESSGESLRVEPWRWRAESGEGSSVGRDPRETHRGSRKGGGLVRRCRKEPVEAKRRGQVSLGLNSAGGRAPGAQQACAEL